MNSRRLIEEIRKRISNYSLYFYDLVGTSDPVEISNILEENKDFYDHSEFILLGAFLELIDLLEEIEELEQTK